MSIILNIDTATETAQVNFAKDGVPVFSLSNPSQKDHAGFLQVAIAQLEKETGINLKQLDAIAVNAGPGSYTGLRVGMASAKGLCYALNKPLIILNTLEVLTTAALTEINDEQLLYCPMIDARRMEVFTAIYKNNLTPIIVPAAMILDEFSFTDQLQNNRIAFFGNGAAKFIAICKSKNASIFDINITALSMASLSLKSFVDRCFTELAYAEPTYLKEFNDGFKA